MITRIEIDGFKTFQDFAVDLAPFQVIIGPNGCGKSNLLEAISLLSSLANTNLSSAFQSVRGRASELFTVLPNGQTADRMRIGVELLVDLNVLDAWGENVNLDSPRLRYSVEIGQRSDQHGIPQIYVLSEELKAIPHLEDKWCAKYAGAEFTEWLYRTVPRLSTFITTTSDKLEHPTVYLTPDGEGGKTRQISLGFQTGRMERTLLSRVETTEFAHALAVRQEMLRWRLLRLEPERLRLPSSFLGETTLGSFGENLPAMLARMKGENTHLLKGVSRDLLNLVPSMHSIDVDEDKERNEYVVFAKMRDGRRVSARVLSNGTLRLLAFSALHHDPQHRGVLGLEEPEEGLHPGALKRLVNHLRDMTTDFKEVTQWGFWKQLLVTTHSTELVSHLDMSSGELLFADMPMRVQPGVSMMLVSRMFPVRTEDGENTQEGAYSLTRTIEFLNDRNVAEARNKLLEAHLR